MGVHSSMRRGMGVHSSMSSDGNEEAGWKPMGEKSRCHKWVFHATCVVSVLVVSNLHPKDKLFFG